tara:strand:+ start:1320 stop:1988 length:669 start_codon:yes stop_codon:yes gene_type:complete
MSNFSTFFPVPGGGGGGGILNEEVFTASGSFDPAAKGLSIGDKVSLFICGGGGGGNTFAGSQMIGGNGGNVIQKTFTLTSTSAIPVNIGAGGALSSGNATFGSTGGNTSVIGSGISLTATGGKGGWGYSIPASNYGPGISEGPHFGASSLNNSTYAVQGSTSSAGPGINGYGVGGAVLIANGYAAGSGGQGSLTLAKEGCGGFSTPHAGGGAGKSGIVKIYY